MLRNADVVQVVAGGPALANACFGAGKPVVIRPPHWLVGNAHPKR